MTTVMNAATAAPDVRPLTTLERRMGWAAVLLQVEITITLVYGTLVLPIARATPGSISALFAVLMASLLFPLGSHLARGSRVAAGIVAILYTLRITEALTAPSFNHMLSMLPLLGLEGFVLLRGVAAALQPEAAAAVDPLSPRHMLLRDIGPMVVALALLLVMPYSIASSFAVEDIERGFMALHSVGLLAFALAVTLVLLHRLPQRIGMLIRGTTATVGSVTDQLPIPAWPRQAWIDIITGVTTCVACVLVLSWYGETGAWPPLLFLLLPLPEAVLAGFVVAGLWFTAAIGEIYGDSWATKVRSLAAILLAILALMIGPLVFSVLNEVLLDALRV